LVGAVLALVAPRDALAWLSGVRPVARAQHAFSLLLWSLAEWCADRGIATLNLGGSEPRGGIATYKEDLGARRYRHPVRWIGPAHAGSLGRWMGWLQDRARSRRYRGRPT
jgi:hypothetical protein